MEKNKLDFSKMTQEEFLKAAFEKAARQEIAELEAMDINVPRPTVEQRKEIEEMIVKMNNK